MPSIVFCAKAGARMGAGAGSGAGAGGGCVEYEAITLSASGLGRGIGLPSAASEPNGVGSTNVLPRFTAARGGSATGGLGATEGDGSVLPHCPQKRALSASGAEQ